MIDTCAQTTERELRLDAILADYFKTASEGSGPEPEELIARYPDLAVELTDFFGDYRHLNRVVEPVRTALSPGAVGRCFGDYELLEEIARGGMGVVYKARQKSLNRLVALKMLFPGGRARDDVERFLRAEAEVAAGLEHPHIVPIYEFGHGGTALGQPAVPFLSMKLIEGGSLAGQSGVRGQESGVSQVEQRQAARVLATVARAVHYAHQRGILHRDLKPSNILLDVRGQPFVTDFGLAQRVEGDGPPGQSGVIVGTALYMSPEQASGEKRLTTAADVYSLGAILYELVTGRPPFRGETIMDTLIQVKERSPVRPRAINPRLDRDLETICLRCLEKDPQRRYDSAEALADDLECWQAGEPIRARRVGRAERSWRWCRRNPAPAAAGIMAVVAVTALVALGVGSAIAVQLSQEQDRTEAALQQAELQRAEAEKQRARAEQQEKLARHYLYAAHVNLAQRAWEANQVSRVLDLLERHRPRRAEDPDLRGFEWHYLWRLSHAELLTLQGHTDGVYSVAFSPDGKRLASASGDKTAKVWNAQTGQETLTLKGHTASVNSVAFSPDGKRLASASEDQTAKVWDAQTGQELLTLRGHTRPIRSIGFSPDGKRLASASGDQTIKVWNAQTGQELLTLKGHITNVEGVAFSPDGKRLASADQAGAVKVWDAAQGQELLTFKVNTKVTTPVWKVVFSPDGKHLATGDQSGMIRVWDAATGQELFTLCGHTSKVSGVAFSPDGKRLASGSVDKTIKLWEPGPAQDSRTLTGHTGFVHSVAFSPDGKRIVSASGGKRDADKRDRVGEEVKVWDTTTGREVLTLKQSVWNVVFSPDGKRIASASFGKYDADKKVPVGGAVKVWDSTTGREVLSLDQAVFKVLFSPDGKRLATASFSRDVPIKVLDAATGQELLTIRWPTGHAMSLAFSPDGKRLAGAGEGHAVKIWDATTGQDLLTLKGQGYTVCVAFSPDGQRLAAAGWDGTVRLWDASTGEEVQTLKGHTHSVTSVAFSPDGKRLAEGGVDQTVKVWDTLTGQELLTLQTNFAPSGLAFSPDGNHLACGAEGGTVKIWDATPLEERPPGPAPRE